MTHFCSLRLTHTKNTICRRARDGASDIIHAEGVRVAFPSSAPKARKAFRLQDGIGVLVETAQPLACGRSVCTGSAGRQKRLLPAGKAPRQGVVVGHFWRAK